MPSTFTLCPDDRITDLGRNWDLMMRGLGHSGGNVRKADGRLFWDFVPSHDTRSFLNALFFHARRQMRIVELPVAINGQESRMEYRMVITPRLDQTLDIRHRFVDQVPFRAAQVSYDLTAMPEAQPEICSNCASVMMSGEWHSHIRPMQKKYPSSLFTICPSCRSAARWALAHSTPIELPLHPSKEVKRVS